MPTVSVILMSLLVIYIPLTHMSHFIGKYFAYHAIRWNDDTKSGRRPPGKGDPRRAEPTSELGRLSYPGRRQENWVDLATEEQKK